MLPGHDTIPNISHIALLNLGLTNYDGKDCGERSVDRLGRLIRRAGCHLDSRVQ